MNSALGMKGTNLGLVGWVVGGKAGGLTRGSSCALDLGSKYTRLVSVPNPTGWTQDSMAGPAALSHCFDCQKVDKG